MNFEKKSESLVCQLLSGKILQLADREEIIYYYCYYYNLSGVEISY
ncbi:MAG: hypothetical protein GF308_00725 [Candidatus Heimdallarchaeota archaeon]|nr:hypothetical protein [Candidatus Heimdallarchaeota archaeon]